jgi:putative ABC transport system permease protein
MFEQFTLYTLAFKNITRKPFRTVILVITLSLLVSAIVFALSFIVRVESSIKLTAERLGADLLIVPAGSRGATEDVLVENKVKSFYMDKGIVERVRNFEGVDKVCTQTYLVTLAGLCCSVPEAMVITIDQENDFIVTPWLKNKLGRKLKRGEAIVGSESAYNISLGLVEVDSMLFGTVFKMIGVLDKTGTGLDTALFIGDENIDDIIKNGKANIKPGQISVIFAKLKNGADAYRVMSDIENNILEVDVVSRKDIGKSLINTLSDISRIFSITVSLASVLSLFLVWAIFTAIANERAREVGIMRAIGAKESHVVRLFVVEIVLLGAAGSMVGIVSGTVLSLMMAKSFAILKNLPTDLTLGMRLSISAAGLVIGTGICVLGALAPIQRIKRMEPLLVIKEE